MLQERGFQSARSIVARGKKSLVNVDEMELSVWACSGLALYIQLYVGEYDAKAIVSAITLAGLVIEEWQRVWRDSCESNPKKERNLSESRKLSGLLINARKSI
jgi:hypothetical protein